MSETDRDFIKNRVTEKGQTTLLAPRPPFPKNIMVELSNACNHKCIFCSNPKMTREKGRVDPALLFQIMTEAYSLGSREIGFYTTGDPFIHKDLTQFVAKAKEMGYTYTYISTNGALATPEKIRDLVDAGIDSIKFSINAGTRETYKVVHGRDDWDIVIANLKFISELRKTLDRPLRLGITYVVLNQNQHEIDSFYSEMTDYVDDIYFSGCGVQGGYMLENDGVLNSDIEPTVMQAPCNMLFNRAHITCEGYLTLCCIDYQNYLALCDLREISLIEAWHAPLFQQMRQRHIQKDLAGTLCHNCINQVITQIEPLREDLATLVDFQAQSNQNKETQRERLYDILV